METLKPSLFVSILTGNLFDCSNNGPDPQHWIAGSASF